MKVKFLPQNVEFEIRPGQSVMHLAHEHEIHIQSVCKGLPSCAECRVKIVEGEFNVIPPNEKELSLIGTAQFVDQSRLACQLRCFGDVTVDLAEQIEKSERTVKKPRGPLNRMGDDEDEGQKTRAVLGNMILTEFNVDEMVDDEGTETSQVGVNVSSSSENKGREGSRPSFYDLPAQSQTEARGSKKGDPNSRDAGSNFKKRAFADSDRNQPGFKNRNRNRNPSGGPKASSHAEDSGSSRKNRHRRGRPFNQASRSQGGSGNPNGGGAAGAIGGPSEKVDSKKSIPD